MPFEEEVERHDLDEDDSGFETEEDTKKRPAHPVLKQLDALRKAGRRLDVATIMAIIVRYFEGGEGEQTAKVSRPSQLQREQNAAAQKLREEQRRDGADADRIQQLTNEKRVLDEAVRR